MSKIILNRLTEAMLDEEKRDKLPKVNVLACGACKHDKFRLFEDGSVVCGACNELAAGVTFDFRMLS